MKRFLLTSLVFFFSIVVLHAQKIALQGSVLDDITKSGLPGVNVLNLSDKRGTSTDFEGAFELRARINDTILFSSVGYYSKKIIVKKSHIVIFLKEQTTQLDEVIISAKTNINDIDSRKVTGSIAKVSMGKIVDRPSVNPIESLQGQIAGLSIKSSGELGKPLRIRIRGTSTLPIKTNLGKITDDAKQAYDNRANQPLFVLDGIVISSEAFATLNVNDIKEIKVLKDAVANALYGIKAANGVIEITSKRGINGKTQYTISSQHGITLKGKPSVKMMETEEKLALERLARNKNTPGYYLSEEYYRTFYSNAPNLEKLIADGQRKLDSLKQINTDWFQELARISTYQSYSVSSRGGNDKSKFYSSASFSKQGGKFEGNDIQSMNGRLNYEYNLSKKAYLMLNGSLGFSENNTPNSSKYSPSELIYKLNPYEQRNSGMLISYPGRTFKNLVNQFSRKKKDNRFNFSANLLTKLATNLELNSVVGVDYLFQRSLSIVPRNAFSEVKSGIPQIERGQAIKSHETNVNISTNTRLNFSKKIHHHLISLSANMDYYRKKVDFVGVSGYGLPSKLSSAAGINNYIEGARRSTTSSQNVQNAQLGFGFSALYGWKDKIELYSSYKTDGSSLMPKEKRWNSFWASGFAYTLSNEDFLQDNKYITHLKLRGTYGKTASLAGVEASLAVPTFAYGIRSYQGIHEFNLLKLFNKNLRPEKNISMNLGLDVGIANNFTMTLEFYKRRTKDMLLTVPIAPSNGFSNQLKNVGVMDNKGVELSINTTLLNTEDFMWTTSANISYNQNKVIDLYDGTELNISGKEYPDYKEGESASLIYGLRSLGVHPVDGIFRYRAADGSEIHGSKDKPTSKDFVVLGVGTAPYSGGWYHNLSYKNWQVSFDLYFKFGGIAKYTNKSVVADTEDVEQNAVRGQLKQTWFEPGDEGKIYETLFGNNNESVQNRSYPSDRTVGRTDFVRLNNVTLRYHLDSAFLKRVTKNYIADWRMYLQLKNIATWSNFGGGDPESANLVGSSQPIITLGLNMSF